MASAIVNPSSLRFPRKCPHCGGKPEGTYAVAAMRGLDVFFGEYAVPLLIDVPVCREAFDRRRVAAVTALVSVLALVLAGGIAALVFAFRGAWVAAMVSGTVAIALAAGGRTGWDAGLLDRWVLGLSARSVSSSELRVRFASDKYFAEWTAMNRSAKAGGKR